MILALLLWFQMGSLCFNFHCPIIKCLRHGAKLPQNDCISKFHIELYILKPNTMKSCHKCHERVKFFFTIICSSVFHNFTKIYYQIFKIKVTDSTARQNPNLYNIALASSYILWPSNIGKALKLQLLRSTLFLKSYEIMLAKTYEKNDTQTCLNDSASLCSPASLFEIMVNLK